jgi:type-F conjugative transfer system pilin assembly protein TrbC
MPITRPSAADVRFAIALTLIGAAGVASLAAAQISPGAPDKDAPPSARAEIEAEGDAAMERLRGAIERRKAEPQAAPSELPQPTEVERRRAFDALRQRAPSPAMEARARDALEAGKDRFAKERAAMAKRLEQALGLEAPDMRAVADAGLPPAAKGWVPVLFASSSMPTATLRTYAAQLEKARGVIAFRGMPGGMTKVAPMAKLTAEILRLDPGCEGPACAMRDVQLIVDPLVFRQHGVTRVPALAMVPGDPVLPYCEREDESPRAAHVVYGDAALSGLLEEIARLGGKEEVRDAQSRLEGR